MQASFGAGWSSKKGQTARMHEIKARQAGIGMNIDRLSLKRDFQQVLIWTGVVVLSAVVAVAQDSAPQPQSAAQTAVAQGGQRTDGQIEMDVVRALDDAQPLKNDLITAATIQGEVTLAGTVSSDSSKKLAESIVSKVPGVIGVNNNLEVGNPQEALNQMTPQPEDQSDPGQNDQAPAQASAQQGDGPGPAPQQDYPQQAAQPYPGQNQYPQQYPDQSQSAQQGQYPPPYPQARPRYAPYGAQRPGYNQPQAPAYVPASGPVTVPPGTLLQLRTAEPLSSKRAQDGQPVQFTLISDVTMGGVLAIPRGATMHGVVTYVRKVGSGDIKGSSALALTLTSLDLGGRNYPINSDQFRVKGPGKGGQTVGSAITGGLIGTIIGCAAGGGAGCAIGAGTGVAAGTAASAASSGPQVWIPSEALVTFHLAAPVTVDPVGQQEAARLAQGLYQGGPSLYQRPGRAYYGPRPYYGPRYYAGYGYPYYPRVYYRPYSMTGGFYYWR